MTQAQAVALGLGLVIIFAVAMIAGVGSEESLLQGMSSEAQAAVVGGIAGGVVGGLLGILGALLGLVVERRMRRSGKITCDLTQELRITWRTVPDRRQLTTEDVAHLEDLDRVEAEVEGDLEFFNEKEVDFGLSHLAIVFIAEDGEEARLNPTDAQQGILSVNVPSRRCPVGGHRPRCQG